MENATRNQQHDKKAPAPAALTAAERMAVRARLAADLKAVWDARQNGIQRLWERVETDLTTTTDRRALLAKQARLEKEQEKIKNSMSALKDELDAPMSCTQAAELGGVTVCRNPYARVFGRTVDTAFEYRVARRVQQLLAQEVPAHAVLDLGKVCERALGLAVTRAEMRAALQDFYTIDFEQHGIALPSDSKRDSLLRSLSVR